MLHIEDWAQMQPASPARLAGLIPQLFVLHNFANLALLSLLTVGQLV